MTNKYQDKFGYPVERTRGKVRLATSNLNGDCDASMRSARTSQNRPSLRRDLESRLQYS